ncbi:MAG: signal peptidase I [Eubacteriales bacterium]|nr:signal peptidase I [Eubacteriales bacterium]
MKKNTVYVKAINCALSLIIIIALLGVMFAMFFKSSAASLSIGGLRLFKIITGSMEPVYAVGDYVISRSISPDKLKEGDIIAFFSENEDTKGEIIIHRIVSVGDNDTFITRGDANATDDTSTVSGKNIIGEIVSHLTFLKYADRLFSRMWAFIVFIAVPLVGMIVNEAVGLVKKAKQSRNISSVIIKYGLDPEDEELQKIARQYGEDAVRDIAESQKQP